MKLVLEYEEWGQDISYKVASPRQAFFMIPKSRISMTNVSYTCQTKCRYARKQLSEPQPLGDPSRYREFGTADCREARAANPKTETRTNRKRSQARGSYVLRGGRHHDAKVARLWGTYSLLGVGKLGWKWGEIWMVSCYSSWYFLKW